MFTATLTIMDLDTGTPEDAARALLACAAGDARPLYISVEDQETGHVSSIVIADYPPDMRSTIVGLLASIRLHWEGDEQDLDVIADDIIATFGLEKEVSDAKGRTDG